MQIPVQDFYCGIDLRLFTDDSLGLNMHREGRTSNTASAITAYFQKVTVASQQETLGNVVGEILREGRGLSRMAICTKLLHRADNATNDTEAEHYNELIKLFFER